MPTILEQITDDLNELHENFEDVEVDENDNAILRLENENYKREDFDEDTKTHQILSIYEQVA